MSYFKQTLENMKQIASQGKAINVSAASSPATALNPESVLQAMATACRSNNSLVQQVAIRLSQVAQQYPNKAAP